MKDYMAFFKKIGFLQTVGLVINFAFYRLQYLKLEDKAGYFLVKRKWMWFLFAPLLLPIYCLIHIVSATIEFFAQIFNYEYRWIDRNKKPMSLSEKITYRRQLWT